jgi:acyl-coenzyme A synthetase/AMP-(fatty) acid ligase
MTAIASFHDIVLRHAAERPDAVYVHSIEQNKSLTYGQLRDIADGLAAFLADAGVAANDRVLILAENSVEFHALFVSVLRYGATVVTLNVDMNQGHLAELLAAIRPKVVIREEGIAMAPPSPQEGRWVEMGTWHPQHPTGLFADIAGRDHGREIPSVGGPKDHGVIFYTSGTVAKPKGVIQSHSAALHNYDATADYLGLKPGMKVLDCRSFTWLSAQNMALGAPLMAGATAVIARKFSASRYFEWLKDHDVNIGFVVPTMVNMLLAGPRTVRASNVASDLPSLHFLTSSSAPLFPDRWKAFETTFGITLCQSGGSSEGGNTAAHRGPQRKIGTLGPPLKHQSVRIVDERGGAVPQGELGEIIVGGGLQQAVGYLNADGTIEQLPLDGHHTGDLGRIDEDGHLIIVGRKKDLIIRGGVNIAPMEIDAVLHEMPGVAEAAAAGVPDPIYGEEVAGFVTLAPGASVSSSEILTHCRTRLPPFKAPKTVLVLKEIPKTSRGKVDRNALVALFTSQKQ